jgi:Flp pilus assembly protein TadB
MTQTKPPRSQPFGLEPSHYLAIRILLGLGFIVVGVTLHHHGAVYVVIRVFYFALIVCFVVWPIRRRRADRQSSGAGNSTESQRQD